MSGLTISSDNGTLVDNGDGTWSFTPATNDNSSVSIDYSIDDGTDNVAAAASFDITPVNDPPFIAAVADQTIDEDTSLEGLLVSASDVEFSGDQLFVVATSSNASLLSDGGVNVTYQGGNNWSVDLLPKANQNGTTTIDLVVSDGDKTAATSFVLTVNPVNDAPTGTVEISGDPIVGQTLSASNVIGDIDEFDEIQYPVSYTHLTLPTKA